MLMKMVEDKTRQDLQTIIKTQMLSIGKGAHKPVENGS